MTRDEKMAPVLDRIPPIWGKSLGIPEEWDDIVLGLDAKLAELDPDYVVLQAKAKFGDLRYYFDTALVERRGEMNELVTAAERAVAELERKEREDDRD